MESQEYMGHAWDRSRTRVVVHKRLFLQRSTRHIWLCFLCTSMPTYSRAGLLCLRPRLR